MGTDRYVLGVDVGGTFTDLALVRLSDGKPFYHKTPTTPEDPSLAVRKGIDDLFSATNVGATEVDYFGHGTTVATNALITGSAARTGLITTEGFRDILEIRRQRQPHNYDIRMPKPPSPVPRHLRREVDERTFLYGATNVALSEENVGLILDDFKREGVEAVAVCFLHSYHNPAHEARVMAAVRERLPEVFACASHEVLAEFREYERFSTTVVNASLGPVMSSYLGRLEKGAEELGVVAPKILQSNGGVASPEEAALRPVRTLASGPAAGVTGATHLSAKAGFQDIITFDVGGTSTDVCLIEGGRPLVAREREFQGNPVRYPMIDVHSVGAGGGSIAWVDAGGFLHVGPRSAGASPGPACYDLGGTEPTVSDANVVLGRLPPDALLGGRMPIRAELARRVIKNKVARPMDLAVEEAAQGVLTILNENLVQAIRVISVERGFDPRSFTLVAFGGAGPLLASSLARELEMTKVVVPASPGLLCALGLLVADVRSDFGLTRIGNLEDSGAAAMNATFAEVEEEARRWFDREGIDAGGRHLQRAIDMRYVGQSHELTVPVQTEEFGESDLARVAAAFRKEHERVYGYAPDAPVQHVTYRVTALAKVTAPAVVEDSGRGTDIDAALSGTRRVHFQEQNGFVDCPIYDRVLIPSGAEIAGPAIIEQMDTTTVVLPGQIAHNHAEGHLILDFT